MLPVHCHLYKNKHTSMLLFVACIIGHRDKANSSNDARRQPSFFKRKRRAATGCIFIGDIKYAVFVIEQDLRLTMALTVLERCDIFQSCFEYQTNFSVSEDISILIQLHLQTDNETCLSTIFSMKQFEC